MLGNLVRISITNSSTTSLQPFPDYANRPARQRPGMKPTRRVSAGTGGTGGAGGGRGRGLGRQDKGSRTCGENKPRTPPLTSRAAFQLHKNLQLNEKAAAGFCADRPAKYSSRQKIFSPSLSISSTVSGSWLTNSCQALRFSHLQRKSPRQKDNSVTFRAACWL